MGAATERLQRRTAALTNETRALGRDKKPGNQQEHEAFRGQLQQYEQDLRNLRERREANGTPSRTRRKVARKRR